MEVPKSSRFGTGALKWIERAAPTPRGSVGRLLLPLQVTVVVYLAAAVINARLLAVDLRYLGPPFKFWSLYFPELNLNASLLPDLLLQIGFGYLLFFVSRRIWIWLLLHTAQMLFIYVGNGVKISYFGEPWVVTDWFLLRELTEVLPSALVVVAIASAVCFFGLLIFNLRLTARRVIAVAVLTTPFVGTMLVSPAGAHETLKSIYGHSRTAPINNFVARGATLYLVDEVIRFNLSTSPPPSASDVDRAIATLGGSRATTATGAAPSLRNVHIIAAESLWDPTQMKSYRYSEDPWSSEFRSLWDATGRSTVMSPVFGGATANAEYEALCGMPVATSAMMFQTEVINLEVPCLPRLLRASGYLTIASHPNREGFWNRNSAYPKIGFSRYRSIRDFVLDETRGPFLSDMSLLRQNREHLASIGTRQPIFNYVLTIAAHWPYRLRGDGAPIISVTPEEPLVTNYANLISESTEALATHIALLRAQDPDALVVVFGDHLPPFGADLNGYRLGGAFPRPRERFSAEDARQYASTPLIVIDGRRGPLSLGNVAMYELPRIVLDLLGLEASVLDLAVAPDDLAPIRPIRGVGILAGKPGQATLCRPAATDVVCARIVEWTTAAQIVVSDLNRGRQYSAKRH